MKQRLTVSFISLLSAVFLFSCSKKRNDDNAQPGGVDPNTPGATNTCSTQKSDVETISFFPADNAWNQDISNATLDPYSDSIIARYGNTGLKADFGSGLWDGAPFGIPFTVVCNSQPKVPIVFRQNSYDGNYGNESDPGPYPIPLNAPIEENGRGDSHVLALDKDNSILYELYNASVNGDHWEASSGAVFDLKSNQLRHIGWTSADAAGLPILAGLVRYDEVEKGEIDHAIRFTLEKYNIKPGYVSPARHEVNSTGGNYSIPFGARIRLKAGFNISTYPARVQVILKAMKKYGLILADVGSNMYVTGTQDDRWNNDELQQLNKVKASNFEVVKFN